MQPERCLALALIFLSGCGTIDHPDGSNLAAYCNPENAFRLGSQSRAYYGECPKEMEAAFLAGLERGRALRPNTPQALPYFQRMQDTERQIVAARSDAEREPLRAQLRDYEWWAIHIVNGPANYGEGH
jgi:uncharacterized protein DUF2799